MGIDPITPSATQNDWSSAQHAIRDVVDAILYIASAGCAWRMLPIDFPPVSTVRYYFYDWRDDGIFEVISHILVAMARELQGKKPSSTAGVVASRP
jgi:putative transposase